MATIVKKTEGLKLLGYNTGLFKKLDESFNVYKKSLKPAREKVSKDYKDLTNQPENKKNGYSYPDIKVFNFEENYLGDLVLIQEQLLRIQIIKALPLQSFQKLHLYDILPVSARQVLSGAFCLVLRYKRLYDLFFRAAAIREKTEAFDFKFGFGSEPRKEIKDKYHLPTIEQLETIVKYSLDTPLCLNILLGKNRLKQFDTTGKEMAPDDKSAYYPEGDNYAINLGYFDRIKADLYIDNDGKIKSGGKEYDIVGLNFSSFKQENIEDHKTKPTEMPIDIMNQKNFVDYFKKNLVDRFSGREYLPTEDNWNLEWNFQDDNLHKTFQFKFREKLPDKSTYILPSFSFERKQKTRQIKLGGKNKTQKRNKL